MKVLFVNKKKLINISIGVIAAALLFVGIGVLYPGVEWPFDKEDPPQTESNALPEDETLENDQGNPAGDNAGDAEQTAAATAIPEPYYNGDMSSDKISLSVNVDWGEEYIADLLKVLADSKVKATFFLTGRWCDNNPELASDIAEAGHEIGNHGYSHSSPNNSSATDIKQEIEKTAQAIDAAAGVETKLYAPPSGESEAHVLTAANELGYDTILWSVDTIDWQKPAAQTIIERVKNKIHGGAIILSHPTEGTVEALATLLPDLQKEGYTFVTVSENIGR